MNNLRSWSRSVVLSAALAAPALFAAAASAAVSVAPIFGSNMVLQRGVPVPVFGTGDVGSTVTVQFGNQSVSTAVGSTGKWQVNLASMNASAAPASMVVSASGSTPVTFTGVQVGEVLLFSGQSNMDMTMNESNDSASYVSSAGSNNIRLFLMKAGSGPAGKSWQVASPTSVGAFSAVGYWAGLEVYKSLDVPVGLIQATHDGTNISEWQTTNGGAGADYLAMVKPIQPYAIKAVGWYQGESNGGDSAYETKLTAMINEWRTDWAMPGLPFGIVQLPSSKWDACKAAQYNVSRKVANTFLVVTHDLPGGSQLHPTTKRPVGRRMGIGLRGSVYGEGIVYSGPLAAPSPASYTTATKVVVSMTSTGSGLVTSSGAPSPAQIATATGRWTTATAVIVGNTIEFSGVTNPKRVRFGYGGAGNLFNIVSIPVEGGAATETRLPASLFELTLP